MAPPIVNIDWFVGGNTLTAAVLNAILGGGSDTNLVNTNLTTTVGAPLTAAALLGGQISRTGPTAAFSDTTDTAAAIVAALGPNIDVGETFLIRYKNVTAFPATILGGTGVTFSAIAVVPPFSVGLYFGKVGGTQAVPTVAFSHMATTLLYAPAAVANPAQVALNTVGAGVILAAAMANGTTLRGGAQSNTPFTDTTDTAANIIAGVFGLAVIGNSVSYRYVNNTNAKATLASGDGSNVVFTEATIVPANSWVEYILTRTAAGIVEFDAIAQGYFPKVGTVTANAATPVAVVDARVTADSQILLTYKSGSVGATGAFVSSSTPGTGFSIKSVASDTAVYNYAILG